MRKRGGYIVDRRMKFNRGYQRKMILRIKNDNGLTWRNLADEFKVSVHTVMNDWGRELTTIPHSLGTKMINRYLYEERDDILRNWIDEILPERWGQRLAGELNKKKIKTPCESEQLAELLGVILGDGHLEAKTLTLTGNFYEVEHHNYVKILVKQLFGLSSSPTFKLKNSLAIQTRFHSKDMVSFLVSMSMVLGNKIKNKAKFPEWVFSKKEFVYAALRGLFDTDGGLYNKQKNYKRAIIEFQTHSPFIRDNTRELLRLAGFISSRSTSRKHGLAKTTAYNTRVQNQEEIGRFFKTVGSANPKNILRYQYFLTRGMIPSRDKIYKESSEIKVLKPYKAALV